MSRIRGVQSRKGSRILLPVMSGLALLAIALIVGSAGATLRASTEADLRGLDRLQPQPIPSDPSAGQEGWPPAASIVESLSTDRSYRIEVAGSKASPGGTFYIASTPHSRSGAGEACASRGTYATGG